MTDRERRREKRDRAGRRRDEREERQSQPAEEIDLQACNRRAQRHGEGMLVGGGSQAAVCFSFPAGEIR